MPHPTPPPLPEVFRDRWILVVDKPSGLPAQPGRDQATPGVPQDVYSLVAATEPYVGLHHRLDTPASGLMVLAIHKRSNQGLAEAFREHLARRTYTVMLLGDPGEAGTWDAPLDGKRARTHWRRLSTDGMMSLVEVELQTGRSHQIRRHAEEAGHPVIGDRRHGGAAGRLWPRLALHAARLELQHPVSGAPLRLEAPLPEDLRGLMGSP